MALALDHLIEALEFVGAELEENKADIELLVAGKSNLLLLGLASRPTRDIDVIGIHENDNFIKATILPDEVSKALVRVRRVMELPEDWINVAASSVMDQGLPKGFEDRLTQRRFGGLTLHLLGRLDLICLKLHAVADKLDPDSKHVQDLHLLKPTKEEQKFAALWTMTQDPSEGFRYSLCLALPHFGVTDGDEWLPKGV